jgi:hypothetical protein
MKSHYDGQEIIDIKIFKFQEKYASVAVKNFSNKIILHFKFKSLYKVCQVKKKNKYNKNIT